MKERKVPSNGSSFVLYTYYVKRLNKKKECSAIGTSKYKIHGTFHITRKEAKKLKQEKEM